MNALANEEVGKYLEQHCVSAFQKVGTFKVTANGQKQGGNVATYFCLSDRSVLHAIAGPVDADTFLTEAKWVVEARKNAVFEAPNHNLNRYRAFFRAAHLERLGREAVKGNANQQQVHGIVPVTDPLWPPAVQIARPLPGRSASVAPLMSQARTVAPIKHMSHFGPHRS